MRLWPFHVVRSASDKPLVPGTRKLSPLQPYLHTSAYNASFHGCDVITMIKCLHAGRASW